MKRFLWLAAALSVASLAPAAAACTLVKLAEWSVRLEGGLPIVTGAIDGREIRVLIDTGASGSLLDRHAAARLGIETTAPVGSVYGIGGESAVRLARLGELTLGKASRRDWTVAVAGDRPAPYDFILGEDFLEQVDLELDYPAGVVRLFEPRDCGGRVLAYWDPGGAVAVALGAGDKVRFDVALNGRTMRALLDTGASLSIVSEEAARHAGVRRSDPGAEPVGCATGIGPRVAEIWRAPFKSIAIGAQTIHDAELVVGRIWRHAPDPPIGSRLKVPIDSAGMVLGSDFLRAHRVYVARSQRRLYFTYASGTVFPKVSFASCGAVAAGPIEEELRNARRRGDAAAVARWVARLEEALRADARDARALAERAAVWTYNEEYGRAVADYDAAIALDPRYTEAYRGRAVARMHAEDWDRALADLDVVLAANPRAVGALMNKAIVLYRKLDDDAALAQIEAVLREKPDYAPAFTLRGDLWARRGDDERAVAEYGRALEADPYEGAHQPRARALFRLGRFEQAARDYARAVPEDDTARHFVAVERYLALARAGGDARRELRQAAAAMGGWPRPLATFLLGDMGQAALLAAAAAPDATRRREQECEAHFVIAQRMLIEREPDKARPWLERARDDCPPGFFERGAAVAELKRLS